MVTHIRLLLAVSALLTITAGVVGAVLSLRRISKIDPATALGGSL
jgi:ABC-type antimicrobial peptide transport system permease subunit